MSLCTTIITLIHLRNAYLTQSNWQPHYNCITLLRITYTYTLQHTTFSLNTRLLLFHCINIIEIFIFVFSFNTCALYYHENKVNNYNTNRAHNL